MAAGATPARLWAWPRRVGVATSEGGAVGGAGALPAAAAMGAEGPRSAALLPVLPVQPPLLLLLAAAAALLGCLWARSARRSPQPPLLAGGPRLRSFLRRHCPAVGEPFRPTAWCCGGRLQTVSRALLQSRPRVGYRRWGGMGSGWVGLGRVGSGRVGLGAGTGRGETGTGVVTGGNRAGG